MSEDEEKYIRQSENDQISRIRRERQLAALRAEEQDGIAKVLHTSDDVAAEALALGFDRETARILHLIPVIQVAWADDRIQVEERVKLINMAGERGVSGAALEFLDLLLDQRPSDLFFERTNKVIAHLLAAEGHERDKDDILAQARAVAASSGGFFGINTVSKDEQKLIDDLEAMLKG